MEWPSDEQQRIWRNYLAMTGGLHTVMHRQLQQDHELSLSDYAVLVALSGAARCGSPTSATGMGWEQSRLSHQLRRMRRRGLVERAGDDADRRAATVKIDEAGCGPLRVAAPGHAELVRAVVFDGMSAADLRALERWTSRVLDRL